MFQTKLKFKYEDSENLKTDHADTVIFNLHQIKQRNFFGTPDIVSAERIYLIFGTPSRDELLPMINQAVIQTCP